MTKRTTRRKRIFPLNSAKKETVTSKPRLEAIERYQYPPTFYRRTQRVEDKTATLLFSPYMEPPSPLPSVTTGLFVSYSKN